MSLFVRCKMKTIIIYNDLGKIYMTQSGDNITVDNGINIIETEIPEGFYPSSVNPETQEVIFSEIPKTKEQLQIEELQKQIDILMERNKA